MNGATYGLGLLIGNVALGILALLFHVLLITAAAIDARRRIFPNGLAVVMAIIALFMRVIVAYLDAQATYVGIAEVSGPIPQGRIYASVLQNLASPLIIAVAVCAALFIFELIWRRLRGNAGLGIGDIKLLFSLALLNPTTALASFAIALILLAITCLTIKKPFLPLIPFLAGTWIAVCSIPLFF